MLLIKYDGRCADTYIYGTRVYNVTWYGAVTAWAIVQLLALDALAQRSTNEISEENEGELCSYRRFGSYVVSLKTKSFLVSFYLSF